MKKILCLALAVLMLLSMVACGGKKAETKEGLQVGYGRADVSPDKNTPTPLGGYGSAENRLSTEVMDSLYATCISISDGKDQVLVYTLDNLYLTDLFLSVRQQVAQETGVAEENIFLSSTHSHSTPDTRYTESAVIQEYNQLLIDGCVAAGKAALKDQSAATMSATSFQAENLNFVRHYYQEATDTYTGDNFGDGNNSTITDHAEPADNEMILVKFERSKGKDILLCNFQAHPCMTGGITETKVSADFIGSVRTVIEKEQDVHFAYFTGAAGNQNVFTKLPSENVEAGKFADMMPYTTEFVRQATEAMNAGMMPIEGYDVKVNTLIYTGKVSRENEDKLEIATELYKGFSESGDRELYNRLAKEAGFMSIYDCNGVITRSKLPDTLDMELSTLSVGGLAMVVAPFEMFSVTGTNIKNSSPYDVTMILSCAGNVRGYIPTQKAYDYGCYESTTARYESGTAEIVQEKFVEMLNTLKGQ